MFLGVFVLGGSCPRGELSYGSGGGCREVKSPRTVHNILRQSKVICGWPGWGPYYVHLRAIGKIQGQRPVGDPGRELSSFSHLKS